MSACPVYSNVMNQLQHLMFCVVSGLQGAEGASWQVVLCRHRDGHRVERLHGGGSAGWRESSPRGQSTDDLTTQQIHHDEQII